MSDPFGFYAAASLAVFALALGVIGLVRRKLVSIIPATRDGNPALYWYGVVFQLALGGVCFIVAIIKLIW